MEVERFGLEAEYEDMINWKDDKDINVGVSLCV